MSRALSEVVEHYMSALLDHLAGEGEAALRYAFELGRRALAEGVGLLDLTAVHHEALSNLLRGSLTPEECVRVVTQAGEIFAEMLAPFEMTQRGYQEANVALHAVNRKLTAANQTLKEEITKRAQAEEQLHQQQAELAHAQRLSTIGEIMAVMAHELSQPLTAISSYMDGAARRFGSEIKANPTLGEILDQTAKLARRAAEIVHTLRGFVRKQDLDWQSVDINKVIQETLSLLSAEARKRKVTITVNLASELPYLQGDVVQLQQLLVNLIVNGMEAMEATSAAGRRLTLRTSVNAKPEIEISVSDTGPGFTSDVANRIFDPFVTTKKQGLGLGLSICRSIVEAHGGRISAHSKAGATFIVTLPIAGCENHHAA
jgi:Signal transduction histidine kinase regulating C4-dicarboxylate transport system